jgi:hypothetical protein
MIEKVLKKSNMRNFSELKSNLSYWLSKEPGERVEALEFLRREIHGGAARLQRSARVIKRSQG